jgi:hypothetical protein
LRIGDCGLKEAGCGRAPEAKCAKRTQFRLSAREWALVGGAAMPAGERLRKTKPIRGVTRLPNAGRTLCWSCGENVGISRVSELS